MNEKTNHPEADWESVLASAESGDEPLGWIHVTPEIVAMFSIRDCEEQLKSSAADPIRLAQAAKGRAETIDKLCANFS